MAASPPQLNVAVVDDDPGVLRSLQLLLESADYGVRLFDSGAALLGSGCLPQIDCLVSDLDMPGMEGHELLRVVRAMHPRLRVVLITGYPDALDRLPGADARDVRCFTKPFRGEQLLAAVDDAIRASRG